MFNNNSKKIITVRLAATPAELKLFEEITKECIDGKAYDEIDASEIHLRLERDDRLIFLCSKYLKENCQYILPPINEHIPDPIYTKEFWTVKRTHSPHPSTFFGHSLHLNVLKKKKTESIAASAPNNSNNDNSENNKKYNKKK